jgi:hypothetical protein
MRRWVPSPQSKKMISLFLFTAMAEAPLLWVGMLPLVPRNIIFIAVIPSSTFSL